jgi:hypothetical protein
MILQPPVRSIGRSGASTAGKYSSGRHVSASPSLRSASRVDAELALA